MKSLCWSPVESYYELHWVEFFYFLKSGFIWHRSKIQIQIVQQILKFRTRHSKKYIYIRPPPSIPLILTLYYKGHNPAPHCSRPLVGLKYVFDHVE